MSLVEKYLVLENKPVGEDLFVLKFLAPNIVASCEPGQFVHIIPSNTRDPLLRRPISLYDVDKKAGTISLLYKVVGKGTKLMTSLTNDDYLDVLGPLGRSFSLVSNKNVLLVGGGVGVAPLVYLARRLIKMNCTVTLLHGAENSQQLLEEAKLREIAFKYLPATMDGSIGYQGYITDYLLREIKSSEIDHIYTCGPEVMMSVVADYAEKNNISGQLSLEEYMACGVGACLGCARKLRSADEAYVKICQDGPVFDFNEIEI